MTQPRSRDSDGSNGCMPTRGNPDVKRDDAHPPPKGLVGAGIKERIPLRRPDDLTGPQEGLRRAGLPE
jgi:hypothetical protein